MVGTRALGRAGVIQGDPSPRHWLRPKHVTGESRFSGSRTTDQSADPQSLADDESSVQFIDFDNAYIRQQGQDVAEWEWACRFVLEWIAKMVDLSPDVDPGREEAFLSLGLGRCW